MVSDPRLDTVLGKAVAILQAFSADDTEVTLAELVRRTSLPKVSVHRIAGDLVHHRFLARTDSGAYRLSAALFELGLRAVEERSLLELAMPFLQDLYERTHETVHLGVLDGVEVVYLAKLTGHRRTRAPSRTGGRMPLHCTAIGKALLAHGGRELRTEVLRSPLARQTPRTLTAPGVLSHQLDGIVASGIAFEREESAVGVVCVAAPVLVDGGSRVLAAISVTGPVGRFRPEAHAGAVRAAATAVASLLGQRQQVQPST